MMQEQNPEERTTAPATVQAVPVQPMSPSAVTKVGFEQPAEEPHRQVLSRSHPDGQIEYHATSITPPSPPFNSIHRNDEMPTPVVATLPSMQDATADIAPAMPTPATTAPSSERVHSPITFENFPARIKSAKDAHYKRGNIFAKTRQMLRSQTTKTIVVSARGHERAGYVPMMRTRPALHKRRYSVDIVTKNWNDWKQLGWEQSESVEVRLPTYSASKKPSSALTIQDHANDTQKKFIGPPYHENEPRVQYGQPVPLPDPRRHMALNNFFACLPPFNDEIYLELGDATIRNDAFRYIEFGDGSYGIEAWMRGESLDMAMEILKREQRCDAYSIDIANSNNAQIFYMAAMCNDGSGQAYDNYRARFRNKRWIFVVVNDAFGGVESDDTKGSHWALIALDRRTKCVHYYDSLYLLYQSNQAIARDVGKGLLLILEEDIHRWHFQPEWHCPNQTRDNLCTEDIGPCGPFVYKMTEMLICMIKQNQTADGEGESGLRLLSGFSQYFGRIFNSHHVRWGIQRAMIFWKCHLDLPRFVYEHDQTALFDEDLPFSLEPPAIVETLGQPVFPNQQQHNGISNHSANARTPSPEILAADNQVINESDTDCLLYNLDGGGRSDAASSGSFETIHLESPDHFSAAGSASDGQHNGDDNSIRGEETGNFDEVLSANKDNTHTSTTALPSDDDDVQAV